MDRAHNAYCYAMTVPFYFYCNKNTLSIVSREIVSHSRVKGDSTIAFAITQRYQVQMRPNKGLCNVPTLRLLGRVFS